MSSFALERVDVVSGRPWIFVSGRLTGGPVAVGEE